jgi:hypothetical protein
LASYFRRKAVLQWLAKETAKNPETGAYSNMVWAFGAAKFPHNRGGAASSPVWAFRKALAERCTMVLVNEYNTSQRCSRCLSSRTVRGVHVPGEKGHLHGVLTCSLCRNKINRDINSARNILYCFWYQLSQDGERPQGFSAAKRSYPEAVRPGRPKNKTKKSKKPKSKPKNTATTPLTNGTRPSPAQATSSSSARRATRSAPARGSKSSNTSGSSGSGAQIRKRKPAESRKAEGMS